MAKKKTEAKPEAKSEGTTKKKAAPAAKTSEAKTEAKAAASSSSKSTKSTRSAAPAALPMVDTSLAAQTAAQMLAAGLGRREQQPADEDKREGSLIRQLKADLNKGHAQVVSNVLDKGAPQGGKRSSDLPFGQKQVGRNQTFGADVTRSGVPRRTSG